MTRRRAGGRPTFAAAQAGASRACGEPRRPGPRVRLRGHDLRLPLVLRNLPRRTDVFVAVRLLRLPELRPVLAE
jgi:hypothetical protein